MLPDAAVVPAGPTPSLPISDLIQGCVERWWASPSTTPDFGPRYTISEQSAREARLSQLAEAVGAEIQQPPRTWAAQRAVQQRYVAQASRLAQFALGFAPDDLEAMRVSDFADLLLGYAREARRFDPHLALPDIIQAGRNVMSAGLLQVLLGRPLELTPAILAYSLLYPFSDNILDDPTLSSTAKKTFNQRFRRRLAGQRQAPLDEREAAIDRLVGMIEGQYDRRQYPRVFASLLAIHAAQTRSLELMRASAAPYEVDLLGVTFDKGGTSVLADAYLVAGELTPREETFAFELGAFLQFVDDLEDVETDLAAGRLSVFALAARGGWRLDALTNRTLHFGAGVLAGLDGLGMPAAADAQRFLQRGLNQALIHTAGRLRRRYTPTYRCELESHTPFRFAFVERLSGRLSRQMARGLPQLAAANLDLGPAAPSRDHRRPEPAVSAVG